MCFLDWLQKAHCILGCLKNIDFSQVLLKGTFLPKYTLILEFETFADGMHSSGATPCNTCTKRTIQIYTCCLLSSFKTYNITFDDMDLLNPSRAIPQKIGCRGGNPGYVIQKVGLSVPLLLFSVAQPESSCAFQGDLERFRSHASQWYLSQRCEAREFVASRRRGPVMFVVFGDSWRYKQTWCQIVRIWFLYDLQIKIDFLMCQSLVFASK